MVPPVIKPLMLGSTPGSELRRRTGSRPRETRVSMVDVSSTEVRTAVVVWTPIGSAVTVSVSVMPALSVTDAGVVGFIRLQLDVDSFDGAEPGQADPDRVAADDQRRHVEDAGGVGRGRPLLSRLRVGDFNQGAGNRQALFVLNDPGDRSGGDRLLRRRDAAECEHQRQRRRRHARATPLEPPGRRRPCGTSAAPMDFPPAPARSDRCL